MSSEADIRSRRPANFNSKEIAGGHIPKNILSPPKKNKCLSFCSMVLQLAMAFSILCLFYVLVSTPKIESVAVSLKAPPPFRGVFEPKLLLTGERLLEGEIEGPESIIRDRSFLYMGTADGKIVRVDMDHHRQQTVMTLGKPPCGGRENEPNCGRPLGMRLEKPGVALVLDAYLGLFRLFLKTGKKQLIFPGDQLVEDKPVRFLDDFDFDDDGIIYFSDASAKWQRRQYLESLMEGKPDGRLIRFDPKTNEFKVLMDNVFFANGVQLSPSQDFVLVAETGRARVLRYWLKGTKKDTHDIFADNLPGAPDNLRPSAEGGYWIAFGAVRAPGFNFIDFIFNKPFLKDLLMRTFSTEFIVTVASRYGLIVEVDQHGRVLRSAHDPDGKMATFSEIYDHHGTLYLASFSNRFLGRVDGRKWPKRL